MNNWEVIALINEFNAASGLAMTFLADGSHAFQRLSKSYGLFTNVRLLIAMKGKKELQDLKGKLGYYGEDLVLAITDLGLGTCWVGGTFDKDELMAERTSCDQPLPQWVENWMKAVLLAPSAKNSQKAMFKYENSILSARIADDYAMDLVDLGIAKKHFEIGAGGKFEFDNGGVFHLS